MSDENSAKHQDADSALAQESLRRSVQSTPHRVAPPLEHRTGVTSDDVYQEFEDGELPRTPWQNYKDPFPEQGDGRVRRALAWLNNHAYDEVMISPVVVRAFADALEDRFASGRVLDALEAAANLRRPTHPVPSRVSEPRLGSHISIGPIVEDTQRVDAIWNIGDLVDHLEAIREQLARPDLDEKRAKALVGLVQRVRAILTKADAQRVTGDVLRAVERTFVLNITAIVVDLRLPPVMRHLANQGLLRKDLLEGFFAPLLADERTCVLAVVRARMPHVADELLRMEDLHKELLARWRDSSEGSKWPIAEDLLSEIGLWTSKEGSLGSTHRSNKPYYVGNLAAPKDRKRVWERLSFYALATGLGRVTVEQFETARALVEINS